MITKEEKPIYPILHASLHILPAVDGIAGCRPFSAGRRATHQSRIRQCDDRFPIGLPRFHPEPRVSTSTSCLAVALSNRDHRFSPSFFVATRLSPPRLSQWLQLRASRPSSGSPACRPSAPLGPPRMPPACRRSWPSMPLPTSRFCLLCLVSRPRFIRENVLSVIVGGPQRLCGGVDELLWGIDMGRGRSIGTHEIYGDANISMKQSPSREPVCYFYQLTFLKPEFGVR